MRCGRPTTRRCATPWRRCRRIRVSWCASTWPGRWRPDRALTRPPQVVPTNVQYTVTPMTVPSLNVTYMLLKVSRKYCRLQLLNELLGSCGGTVIVTTALPDPLPELGAMP